MKASGKKKTLGGYIIRKYISFLLIIIVLFSLIYNIVSSIMMYTSGTASLRRLDAENIISADYGHADTEFLESLGGWIEILDEENRVVYTKGEVQDPHAAYTQQELLEQTSFQSLLRKKTWRIAGVITISYKSDAERLSPWVATFTTFERGGRTYTGMVRLPADRLSFSFSVLNPGGELGTRMTAVSLAVFPVCALIFIFFLHRYARSIRNHVTAPNARLVDGLRKITSGDYGVQVALNAEYEYQEIEDSFNYLSQALLQATKERDRLAEERRQLLSNIAHDLKTPITTIQGCAQALREGMVRSREQQEEYLDAVCRKSAHMTELITRLLEFSRLENDSYRLHPVRIDFAEFVRSAVIEQLDAFEERSMELTLSIPEHEIPADADPTELRRILANLIGNCIVHNPEGTCAEICVREEADFCSFEIWDNGAPIPDELKASIFEPFVCGDASRSRGGSGLGLSIARKAAERHGGSLLLLNRADGFKGFVLRLPKAA